ncbi:MAG: protein arginine kinase [Candidatus Edwardsbacteria bacterium]
MAKVEQLLSYSSNWLTARGSSSGIVLSSRVRAARNLEGFSFPLYCSDKSREEIINLVQTTVCRSLYLKDAIFFEVNRLPHLDRQFLLERHLISTELVEEKRKCGLFVGEQEILGMMINEEDHLRLQAMSSGLQLVETFQLLSKLDDELQPLLPYAFHQEWGYLTACPTNTGTGLRASILIHLPALVLTKEIDKVLKSIFQIGLAVRGLYGEGTEVKGNFFQISNQTTLGRSEEELIEMVDKVTRQIILQEINARELLLKEAKAETEDKIWRAKGILENARVLTSEEVINLSSAMRLGVTMEILKSPDIQTLNELLIFSQPAHLQKILNREMQPQERDTERAQWVRRRLCEGSARK